VLIKEDPGVFYAGDLLVWREEPLDERGEGIMYLSDYLVRMPLRRPGKGLRSEAWGA